MICIRLSTFKIDWIQTICLQGTLEKCNQKWTNLPRCTNPMIKHVCLPWGQRWRFPFKEGIFTKRLRRLSCARKQSHGVKRALVPACQCSSRHLDEKEICPSQWPHPQPGFGSAFHSPLCFCLLEDPADVFAADFFLLFFVLEGCKQMAKYAVSRSATLKDAKLFG